MIINDDAGNSLSLEGEKIFLSTKKERRMIGELIDSKGMRAYRKKVTRNHIFNQNDSWGICYAVLDFLEDEDVIALFYIAQKKCYSLTKAQVLEKGSFLWFKKEGFERQLFIPRSEWAITKMI